MATFNPETKIWEGPKVPYEFPPDTSIGAELLKNLSATPERVLHICHDDGISMTCEETKIASIRIAQNLSKLGFKQGDVFGFICRNSINLPSTLYGSILIGAPVNPLDAGFKKDDIKHIFGQTKPKLVFCDGDVYETTKLALNELENDATIITLRTKVDGVTFIEELLVPTGSEESFV
jgi:4-coumarate--CoA ligase